MTEHLISPDELHSNLARFRVCDVRWKLNDPGFGATAYQDGHIPGAVRVDLDNDLSGPPGPGRHPLPEPEEFARALERFGIGRDTDVVAYDDVSGMVAARMWWMLHAVGHGGSVRVLDGGFQAWVGSGYPITGEVPGVTPTHYPIPDGYTGVVEIDGWSAGALVDVRAAERYRGEVEPADPVPGHIPGAASLPAALALDAGRFRSPEELAGIYGQLDAPVMSCGSGVVACHSALAMALAGLGIPPVYIGSYSEWSRTGRPVATGERP